MNRLEKLGTELAMLLRREFEQVVELQRTKAQIDVVTQRIQDATTEYLYGSTGEIPRVPIEQWQQ